MGLIIRKAVIQDFDQLLPLFVKAHKRSPFKNERVDEEHIRRLVAVASVMDVFFFDVVEYKGKIVGALGGVIDKSAAGIKVATDIINISYRDTDKLFTRFIAWAKDNDAKYVSITNISSIRRYDDFIIKMGFQEVGMSYLMEV